MNESQKLDVPEESAADVFHQIVKAAISSVPMVGGSSAELFTFLMAPPLEKRRRDWMKSVAERLGRIEARVSELREDPSFVTTVVQATQIATRTHQEEKLEALRNVVINSAKDVAPEDDMRSFFLYLVDIFTPTHLQILKSFNNRSSMNAADFSRLRAKGDVADQMVLQLVQHGLLQDPRPYAARVRETTDLVSLDWTLSQLGRAFLQFITS